MRRIARLASRKKESLILNGLLNATDTLLIGYRDGSNGWYRIKNFVSTTIKTGYGSGVMVSDSVYANGKIFTVGHTGSSSIDGDTYTITPGGGNLIFSSVAYGNGIFVGITSDVRIAYSYDGINWTGFYIPGSVGIISGRKPSVCFGNGKFIAYANTDQVLTSTDGINWTQTSSTALGNISYANDMWFGTGTTPGHKYRSQWGVSWETVPNLTFNTAYTNVVYSNGKYIILSMNGYVYRSSDGITWSLYSGQYPTPSTKLVAKGLDIAYGTSDGYIVYSRDGGASWAKIFTSSAYNFRSLLMI